MTSDRTSIKTITVVGSFSQSADPNRQPSALSRTLTANRPAQRGPSPPTPAYRRRENEPRF